MGDQPMRNGRPALIGGATLGGVYLVNKADRKREVASGAVAGIGGGSLAYVGSNVAGQTTKATLKNRRAKRGTSVVEDRTWTQHKAKNPGLAKYTKYPKSLPDWKAQRALAFKNNPKVGAAIWGAGAGAGAVFGVRQAKKKDHAMV